ncbi:hypothetical protein F8388_006704 [Cannabis sativa]|uniref:Uncharacterized protein n=1 Tax=Cannabis sativa TaxID=3483 RepID=A0A7J6GXA2_CANSA|nr:hypothetical protein F8388_006704 [Cannabis sativa]KAF4397846.1 hypothetical protein G4B88_019567 [Cannabis sativa]
MCESVLNHSHPLRSLELLRLPESPSPSSPCSRVCCSSRFLLVVFASICVYGLLHGSAHLSFSLPNPNSKAINPSLHNLLTSSLSHFIYVYDFTTAMITPILEPSLLILPNIPKPLSFSTFKTHHFLS